MSAELTHLVLFLSSFWAILYIIRHYRRRACIASILPGPHSSTSLSSDLFSIRTTRVTVHNFHLRLQSTACHAFALPRTRWKALFVLAYDVGSVLGVLGMFASVLLLVWTTLQYRYPLSHTGSTLHKRTADPDRSHRAPLQLIIPGLTTPLHHLPVLLLALLATQIIHEAGHALAAALESISPASVGLGFTVILPSAFVAFSTDQIDSLLPRPRARIISAGAFHNLILWITLATLAQSGVSGLIWPTLGYRDVSAYGRVVIHVDEQSPLYVHLPVGAVVYKVGDATLGTGDRAAHQWEALLSKNHDSLQHAIGWCTEEPWFTAQSTSCCASRSQLPATKSSSQACFTPLGKRAQERCVDPLRFLDAPANTAVRRCRSVVDCGHDKLCVGPRGDQELVSLTIHLPMWLRNDEKDDVERTVVWQGDRSEILQEVEVGNWLPSYRMLPMSLPGLCETLFMYLEMLTLSLYFFNLLPLPFLDGGQLLDTLLDWSMSHANGWAEFVALEELESGREAGGWQSGGRDQASVSREMRVWCRQIIHVGVGVLLAACGVSSLTNMYL